MYNMMSIYIKEAGEITEHSKKLTSGTAGRASSHSFLHTKYMYQYIPLLWFAVSLKNCMVAYFNSVVLSDLYVDLSDL